MVAIEYYSLDVGNIPENFASYKEKKLASLTTKSIDTTISASQDAEELEAGDPVNFTLRLELPECETNLSVVIDLPAVPEDVIDLSRKRRDVSRIRSGIEVVRPR